MNTQTALNFLRQNQPLPSDADITNDLLETYKEVCEFLIANPIDEALPLLLNSFGDGSGHGLYQLVENTVAAYSDEQAVHCIAAGLLSRNKSIRYWNANIAALYQDVALLEPLAHLLGSNDEDDRWTASTALFGIDDPRVEGLLEKALAREPDAMVREIIDDSLKEHRKRFTRGK